MWSAWPQTSPTFTVQWATAALAAALLFYWYATYHYGKWRVLGVPHTEPTPLLGHVGPVIAGRAPMIDVLWPLYRRFACHRYFGLYQAREPVLVIRDPELVRAVMVRDFASFRDRFADNVSFKHDGLFDHLFHLRGDRWKAVRAKLTPTFSAAKLKAALADVAVCSGRLIDRLNRGLADRDGTVDVSEASAQYTIDTIGHCAFGLDFKSLSDPDSEFHRVGRDVFNTTSPRSVALNFVRVLGLGRLLDLFRVRGMRDCVYEFFDDMLATAIGQHESGASVRNDFVALLVRLRDEEKHAEPGKRLFTDTMLAANAFVFFIAGFETTASTITYCLYELARSPDIQDKMRSNINRTLNANDGQLSYDTLKDMKYLDMVINETLRMHPPIPVLTRVCTKKYTIPDSDLTLNVGEKLMIPTYSLHYDPKYYPDPNAFDPERFTDEGIASRPLGTFLPFGDGPRICIGMRFALMEIKRGLAEILTNFEVMPCKETPEPPIKIKAITLMLTPVNPICLKFTKIK